MFTCFIDNTSKMPIYEQLYRQIRDSIEDGLLSAGTKMPSKRALADHLKISTITVQTAYDQLIAEGYLHAVERSGTYVEAIEIPTRKPLPPYREPIVSVAMPYEYDLRTNTIDPSLFPSKLWSRLTRRILSEEQEGLWNSLDVQGSFRLRNAIAAHLERFRGMTVDPTCIVVGTGSEYLLDLLVKLFGRSIGYAVEHPGYLKVLKVLETAGAIVSGIPVDDDGLDVSALNASGADIVHVTPSHQFPMGVVMPIRRRGELLRWAKAVQNRYVIEDDYDSEFRFAGAPIPSLKRLDESGHVIYLNSFTKSLAPSLRIAYMVLPESLVHRFLNRFSHLHCPVPNLEQETLLLFLEEGHFERHVNRMKIAYRERRDEILTWIRHAKGFALANVRGEEAGLHFLLRPNTGATEEQLVSTALAQGVRVYGLSEFRIKNVLTEPPTIVIGYAGIDQSRLGDLFSRLETAWGGGKASFSVLQ